MQPFESNRLKFLLTYFLFLIVVLEISINNQHFQKHPTEVFFCKKGVLRNFAKTPPGDCFSPRKPIILKCLLGYVLPYMLLVVIS